MKIKVLVVDDSALIRSLMTEIIKSASDMELVGTAQDAFVARDLVNKFAPDVITLDIEMPKVDGLTFLSRLMKARPTPVVMMSTLTQEGADATFKSIELGAVDFIAKPSLDVVNGINQYSGLILEKIRTANQANVRRKPKQVKAAPKIINNKKATKIIAIGASTGGTEAIRELLEQFPADSPGIVITQHLPSGFTQSYANRLNRHTQLNVFEAKGGEVIQPGTAYLAPGGKHLTIIKSGGHYVTQLDDSEKVCGHKPSVDLMFNSLAEFGMDNVIAIILTGMGKDGAQGMKKIYQNGGFTIAQNEETCVVFGMPREAIKLEVVHNVLALEDIAANVFN
ncbi:protein-glutamate methylesterase/protein-glutamine glutaminase [Marinomonas sp. PE14-40]|uniref:protein-glutamate methylesterase/protein-glutamine glutaminase n=1 Tax=Marinomonas sp. PE14-40 TaxID=3060621 RepID=UPI003F665933